MTAITIAYAPEYLNWQLGAGHPTNPERARIAVDLIAEWAVSSGVEIRTITPDLALENTLREASAVHADGYLNQFHNGVTSQWDGINLRLRDVAAIMFSGTVDLVEDMLAGWGPGVWFNPQGAKHHAQDDHASGFCVLNDMAWAAKRFSALGKRVLYVDWDAHHGDGVEALLLNDPSAVTASIHNGQIFPGTGQVSMPDLGAYNWPLTYGAGDAELAKAMHGVCALADSFQPDVILLACGADGLAGDPLGALSYSLDGIGGAAAALGAWAATHDAPVLVGGAGGYQPLTETPKAWARAIGSLHEAFVLEADETLAG